jgi:hypothetical protein
MALTLSESVSMNTKAPAMQSLRSNRSTGECLIQAELSLGIPTQFDIATQGVEGLELRQTSLKIGTLFTLKLFSWIRTPTGRIQKTLLRVFGCMNFFEYQVESCFSQTKNQISMKHNTPLI